ncbi:MAG: ATP-dependent helicase, partial [Candidatus Rokuibacteriota bacterium]
MAGDRILDGLNDAQREAVTHDAGPLLIVAGAGTGKTTVITRRIAWLIGQKKARPEEILALTFTEKAAAEMEERVDTLVPYGYADVEISTFHAFGDRLLKENALELGLDPEFRVLSRAEQIIFLRERIFALPLRHYRPLGDPTRHLRALVSLFSRLKDEDVAPSEYWAWAVTAAAAAREDAGLQEAEQHLELTRAYAAYQGLMGEAGCVDFGDQIVLALLLFRTRPHVLRRLQSRFKYILVDEFQDTNYAQFELVKLLAAAHRNVTVVGDDDQAIFRFRGASMSNILDFERTYPGARRIVLNDNYRSPQAILDAAYTLIRHNDPDRLEVQERIDKRLVAVAGEGKPPEHLAFDTLSSEADRVAEIIAGERERGRRLQDIAILVRANADAREFLRALNMHGIPWTFSGDQGLYDRPEVRLLIAFLRAVALPDDSVSVHYLASSHVYQVPIEDLTRCAVWAYRKNRLLFDVLRGLRELPELRAELSEDGALGVDHFAADVVRYMELARETPTGELLYQFMADSGLIKHYTTAPPELEQEIQNVAKFFMRIRDASRVLRYDRVPEFVRHLDALIEAGDDPTVAEAAPDIPAVHVLTVHKAKGLEWPVVFLVNLAQQRFPTTRRREALEMPRALIKDTLPAGDFHIQEERRLFYVGMTRARDALYLTSAEDLGGKRRAKVSQFVLEALGLTRDQIRPFRAHAAEELQRSAPPPPAEPHWLAPLPDDATLRISHYQVDDYRSCPLKYEFVHVKRIPLPPNQAIAYGSALHTAVEFYLRRRAVGAYTPLEDLLRAFDGAWRNEGFLSREHEEQRKQAGVRALTRFHAEEEARGEKPGEVEKDFGFALGNDLVRGRFDRVDETVEGRVVIDYKSSDVTEQRKANERARDSLQLKIYSLAIRETTGLLPVRVELRFFESGLTGFYEPTDADAEDATAAIKTAAAGIRRRDFRATPSRRT